MVLIEHFFDIYFGFPLKQSVKYAYKHSKVLYYTTVDIASVVRECIGIEFVFFS
jgi:hypothetical protein